ncbi:MAG: F0F1 ATP synthase subunit delta [Gammaproteobacteria bacterium]|jgi:F-type H+-transporting ATPase subunit b
MELNWSTFILEIINFLVLVWILKRFLYKPVLDVIARRRAGIEKTLSDARKLHDDAERLQQEYEGRLAEWEKERQQARETLAHELEEERSRRMETLQQDLEQQKRKVEVAEKQRQADAMRRNEETALLQGARFAARLLELGSGPQTQSRLVEIALDGLAALPDERLARLRKNFDTATESVIVTSAYPLPDEQRERLSRLMETLLGAGVTLRFEQQSELLAGVRIMIGAWTLAANLQDELKGFAEIGHDDQ